MWPYSATGLCRDAPRVHRCSALAIVLGGLSASNHLGTMWGIPASPAEKLWGCFASLGGIAFAFNCSPMLIEIQSTLREPPKSVVGMRKALCTCESL